MVAELSARHALSRDVVDDVAARDPVFGNRSRAGATFQTGIASMGRQAARSAHVEAGPWPNVLARSALQRYSPPWVSAVR
jgi:hypothetical protein